jgi:hypothetical protein
MHRRDFFLRFGLCAVALEIALHRFPLLLPAEEGFYSMTQELTAGFPPLLAFLVCGFKEFWRQANGDLDGLTHSHISYQIILKYEKSMNNQNFSI